MTSILCEHSRACRALRFFASTSRDKKFALRAASSLESTTREQRALLIFSACSNPYGNPFLKNKTENILKRGFNLERTHSRGPEGSQSGQEKRRDESFQVRAKEPLGTDSHRTISKNASRCRLLIGHKNYFVFILCPIGKQFLLSSFREFVYEGLSRSRLVWLMHQRNESSQETFSLI